MQFSTKSRLWNETSRRRFRAGVYLLAGKGRDFARPLPQLRATSAGIWSLSACSSNANEQRANGSLSFKLAALSRYREFVKTLLRTNIGGTRELNSAAHEGEISQTGSTLREDIKVQPKLALYALGMLQWAINLTPTRFQSVRQTFVASVLSLRWLLLRAFWSRPSLSSSPQWSLSRRLSLFCYLMHPANQ
jgi:hypothetical protein